MKVNACANQTKICKTQNIDKNTIVEHLNGNDTFKTKARPLTSRRCLLAPAPIYFFHLLANKPLQANGNYLWLYISNCFENAVAKKQQKFVSY